MSRDFLASLGYLDAVRMLQDEAATMYRAARVVGCARDSTAVAHAYEADGCTCPGACEHAHPELVRMWQAAAAALSKSARALMFIESVWPTSLHYERSGR